MVRELRTKKLISGKKINKNEKEMPPIQEAFLLVEEKVVHDIGFSE